ncbi:hypothetical protein [Aestuariispira insulae]|uniref:Uncharacterized protein n=1 Tax=Aestuariispira insulae TaxID=1461337 RepID=A0A3D9HNN8_9PROT|nr:hypothetical protein [Aestuariispira insulae]RED51088.1 hypothetical protein DFP90_104368 [Aestuariispira insulae]
MAQVRDLNLQLIYLPLSIQRQQQKERSLRALAFAMLGLAAISLPILLWGGLNGIAYGLVLLMAIYSGAWLLLSMPLDLLALWRSKRALRALAREFGREDLLDQHLPKQLG